MRANFGRARVQVKAVELGNFYITRHYVPLEAGILANPENCILCFIQFNKNVFAIEICMPALLFHL